MSNIFNKLYTPSEHHQQPKEKYKWSPSCDRDVKSGALKGCNDWRRECRRGIYSFSQESVEIHGMVNGKTRQVEGIEKNKNLLPTTVVLENI